MRFYDKSKSLNILYSLPHRSAPSFFPVSFGDSDDKCERTKSIPTESKEWRNRSGSWNGTREKTKIECVEKALAPNERDSDWMPEFFWDDFFFFFWFAARAFQTWTGVLSRTLYGMSEQKAACHSYAPDRRHNSHLMCTTDILLFHYLCDRRKKSPTHNPNLSLL